MLLNIICVIQVVLGDGPVKFIDHTQVKGHIISEGEKHYYVDFSQEAKRLEYIGDYSGLIVYKDDCEQIK